jgi:hypothetical protein
MLIRSYLGGRLIKDLEMHYNDPWIALETEINCGKGQHVTI